MTIGQRLFLNYCAQCHASDARGGNGFPNLTDDDWLYGGDSGHDRGDHHQRTQRRRCLRGRPSLGDEGVKDLANYVKSPGRHALRLGARGRGKTLFPTNCVACHGPQAKGNQAIGAPNLTDDIWLYGGSESTLIRDHQQGPQQRDAGA